MPHATDDGVGVAASADDGPAACDGLAGGVNDHAAAALAHGAGHTLVTASHHYYEYRVNHHYKCHRLHHHYGRRRCWCVGVGGGDGGRRERVSGAAVGASE